MKTPTPYLILAALLITPLLTVEAGARERDGKRHKGTEVQQIDRRIHQGIRSGSINYREARSLHQQQRHLNRLKRRFRADGHLSSRERNILFRERGDLERQLKYYRHNDNYRVGKSYWGNRYYRGDHHSHHGGNTSGAIIFRW